MPRQDRRAAFEPHFDGRETLEGLLQIAGSPLGAEEVLARFEEAVAQKHPRDQVIPALFESEPRFPDPSMAKMLYENLFGLWALVESGKRVVLDQPVRTPKKPPPPPPGPFGEVMDEAWLDDATAYLDGLEGKQADRLDHAFENRQDALFTFVDDAGLSDAAFLQVRGILFQVFALLETGWPEGLKSLQARDLENPPEEDVPGPLQVYVSEALFEAEHDEDVPLPAAEVANARRIVERAVAALWSGRKPRAQS